MDNNIINFRHEYKACLKLANETDSKKEDLLLREEAKKNLDNLRRLCSHEHIVILNSLYNSPRSYDNDDISEKRICLCCGICEYSGTFTGSKFLKLINTPISRFESDAPKQILTPLSYLLTEVIEIAKEKGYKVFPSFSWGSI